MGRLLIATNNLAKVEEIKRFLHDVSVVPVSLKELGVTDVAPEDGMTFRENALAKARFYSGKTGLPALADDGGIEIDALGGAPGVASHRWVSKTKDDDDDTLIAYTLSQMKGIPPHDRGAQMHVVLALVLPDGREFVADGMIRGVITEEPGWHRTPGFPFRALFFLPDIKKFYDHSAMTEEENQRYNHRKQALEQIKPFIKQLC